MQQEKRHKIERIECGVDESKTNGIFFTSLLLVTIPYLVLLFYTSNKIYSSKMKIVANILLGLYSIGTIGVEVFKIIKSFNQYFKLTEDNDYNYEEINTILEDLSIDEKGRKIC